MIQTFFKQVIAEEDAIRNNAEEIRKKVKLLEDEITRLKSGNSYHQRNYCKFSNGYNCKFTGTCTHKDNNDDGLFGSRCFAEKHAREALKGEKV